MYHTLRLLSNRNNIGALHHQALKGRQILITERPDLHLVWYYDRIFIKPIPRCLLNHAFFKSYVSPSKLLQLEAKGFLRTYAKMIVHESDFDVAKEKRLLPYEVTWTEWCQFIRGFGNLRHTEVARRYHYGELRTRLNFYCKLFFYEWIYFETYTQYTWYFTRFIAPYVFIFGGITVVLTAMQAALAADPESVYKHSVYGFSTFSIGLTGFGLAFFPLLYLFFQLKELLLYVIYHQEAR
jgi:hypothetical protein